MGLRLVAHYFEPVEALIVQSVVHAAGIPCFVHGFFLISMQPAYTMTYGGYRLMVHADDLADAVSVIREARANPLMDGEHYVSSADFLDRALSLLAGWLAGGAAMPIRSGAWTDRPPS